jgi:hypothetical protein
MATDELMRFADQLADDFRSQVVAVIEQFVESEPTPQKTLDLENTLHDRFRELGRRTMAWAVNQLEPDIEQMPGAISHKGKSYRRLPEKTQRWNELAIDAGGRAEPSFRSKCCWASRRDSPRRRPIASANSLRLVEVRRVELWR